MTAGIYDHYLCMTDGCKYRNYIALYSGKIPEVPTCSECGAYHVKKQQTAEEDTLDLVLGLKKE